MVIKAHKMNNQQRVTLFFQFKGKCHWCKRRTRLVSDKTLPDDAATIDHIHPKDGLGNRENEDVVLACHKCNQERGHEHSTMLLNRYGNVIYRADEE